MVHAEGDALAEAWADMFLISPAVRILGGSDEIQRNIIAERVLGLPREIDDRCGTGDHSTSSRARHRPLRSDDNS